MPAEDRRVCEQVRRILTSYWIDLAELRFTCTRGTLRFTGILRRLPSEERRTPLHAPLLEVVANEIKRLRGVNRVYFTGVTVDDAERCSMPAERTTLRLVEEEEKTQTPEPEATE